MMRLKWLGTMIACAVIAVAAAGCDGDGTTGSGGDGGTGAGGSTSTGGGGGTGGSTTSPTTSTSSGSTSADPCAGVIEGFVPEWKPSEGLHQGLCADEAQVNAFFAACIEAGATQETCNAFGMDNGPCAQCIVSGPDDEKYGPITLYDELELIYENPGQCVSEIEGDPSEASCGAKIFSTIQCGVAACSECKDVEFNTLLQCLTDAEQGSCKSFADERDACVAQLEADGVPIEPCLPPANPNLFYTYLKELSLLACGP